MIPMIAQLTDQRISRVQGGDPGTACRLHEWRRQSQRPKILRQFLRTWSKTELSKERTPEKSGARFRSTHTKLGVIQRRLVWPWVRMTHKLARLQRKGPL